MKTRPVQLRLTEKEIETLKKLGNGSASQGVRNSISYSTTKIPVNLKNLFLEKLCEAEAKGLNWYIRDEILYIYDDSMVNDPKSI